MRISAVRCIFLLSLFFPLLFCGEFHVILLLVQFNFGVLPLPGDQDPALKTPCLAICPTAASRNSIRNVVSTDSQCPQVLFLQQTYRLKSLTKSMFVLRKHLINFYSVAPGRSKYVKRNSVGDDKDG